MAGLSCASNIIYLFRDKFSPIDMDILELKWKHGPCEYVRPCILSLHG